MNATKSSVAVVCALALSGLARANVGNQNVDGTIPAGTATLDGNLSEWSGAVWRNVDQTFTGHTIFQAGWDPEWTARWDGDTIYVAIRVTDINPLYSDTYTNFFYSDRIELYSRGSGAAAGVGMDNYGNSAPGYAPAQQYSVGITEASIDDGGGDSWGTLGPTEFGTAFPDSRNLVNDGTDSLTVATSATGTPGVTHSLIYEVAIKQYNTFNQADPELGLRTLAIGDQVGFAAAVASQDDVSRAEGSYRGTVSAGGQGGMFNAFNRLGLYELVGVAGDFDGDTDVDGSDFLEWQRGGAPTDPKPSSVDFDDWKANYGTPVVAVAAVAAVPEPTSFLLIATATLALATGRRRR